MKRPNILIFMSDQQRADTVPPFSRAITPNLDKFAEQAVMFTQTYCPSPHCSPSRATFFTGLYPTEHGVWNNVAVGNALSRGMFEGTRLWSDFLRESGYRLFLSGKWHISMAESPQDRGWETGAARHYSAPPEDRFKQTRPHQQEWKEYLHGVAPGRPRDERRPGEIIRPGYPPYVLYGIHENPYRDQDVVDHAVAMMRDRQGSAEPWCHYVGTLGPHEPLIVPQRFVDWYKDREVELPANFADDLRDKPNLYRRARQWFDQLTEEEHKEAIRYYLAFCSYEDFLFGQLLKVLEEQNELDNTIVIYTSDHGEYAAEHGLWAKGLPCFRSAYHVPLLIRWPQGLARPGRTVEEMVSLADIGPTLLEMAGVSTEHRFSGASLVPFLRDRQPESWRDALYTQSNGNELYGIQRSVMTREWKFVYNGFDFDELYDLQRDPGEMHNLASDPRYREVIQELSRKMWQFAYDHQDASINSYIATGLASFGPGVAFDGKA